MTKSCPNIIDHLPDGQPIPCGRKILAHRAMCVRCEFSIVRALRETTKKEQPSDFPHSH